MKSLTVKDAIGLMQSIVDKTIEFVSQKFPKEMKEGNDPFCQARYLLFENKECTKSIDIEFLAYDYTGSDIKSISISNEFDWAKYAFSNDLAFEICKYYVSLHINDIYFQYDDHEGGIWDIRVKKRDYQGLKSLSEFENKIISL